MKQQKDNWVKILFSFAAPCKGKMALSVFCAILSVAGGFIPFWAVYEILLAFINQNVTLNGILIWCLVGAAGYLLRVACHGISTILAHGIGGSDCSGAGHDSYVFPYEEL